MAGRDGICLWVDLFFPSHIGKHVKATIFRSFVVRTVCAIVVSAFVEEDRSNSRSCKVRYGCSSDISQFRARLRSLFPQTRRVAHSLRRSAQAAAWRSGLQ